MSIYDNNTRIRLNDDAQTYLNWGNLVVDWICGNQDPPQTVGDLRTLMDSRNICGQIDGDDSRSFSVQPYSDTGPDGGIILYIPTQAMYEHRMQYVKAGPYPRELMPSYVDIAYGGAPRVNLSDQEAKDFAARRIGEYVINECC